MTGQPTAVSASQRPSESGSLARPREGQHPLHDWGFIDTQYANKRGRDHPEEYAKEPWLHCQHVANAYLSIRVDRRQDFMKGLDEKSRERVQHEIDRITKARARFEEYDDKKELLRALKNARQEWKKEVADNVDKYIMQHESSNPKDKWAENGGVQAAQLRYRELLARTKAGADNWTKDGSPQANTVAGASATTAAGAAGSGPPLGPDCGFKACAMYFEPSPGGGWVGKTSKHPWYDSTVFPNQKMSTEKLLEKSDDNPLTKREGKCLRYFHFPANNMGWIERAMARYYGEEVVVHENDSKHHSTMSQAERILCREFWRGQLHGGGSKAPIHARHMRSRCSLIPRDSSSGILAQDAAASGAAALTNGHRTGKNLALFVPYLHWETDNRREKMSQAIKDAENPPESQKKKAAGAKKKGEQLALAVLDAQKEARKRSRSWMLRGGKESEQPGLNKPRTKLGEYLMQLAKVADAMDYEGDERFLRQNLHKDPPLHIRRTLDQYYFLTLEDTSARDRDQVVYRETLAGRSFHTRNTRVVMVDQLWLWILDDDTIITSYPRRWGRNKPDPSGVHKCLREYLSNNRNISSIYHLALIIIDQCSRVFFDRTKPLDQRPEVIDIFGSAIGNVTEHTTIAHDIFWRNTALHIKNFLPNDSGVGATGSVSRNTSQKYLDINPEGTLLREGRDIAEELKIMQRVFKQQWQVVKDLRRYLGLLNGDVRQERDHMKTLIRGLIEIVQTDDGRRDEAAHGVAAPHVGDAGSSPGLTMAAARDGAAAASSAPWRGGRGGEKPRSLDDTVQEADILLESIENRQAEIQDLEDAALRTCQQLEGLLSLKQQQANIVEAKAALARASESVKQGRSIMAFTIVTIFFLPLGFFAAFFGMNNNDSTGDAWMSLNEQLGYMFGLSSIVIVIAVSIAFSSWVRTLLTFLVQVPLFAAAEYTQFRDYWNKYAVDEVGLERRNSAALKHLSLRGRKRDEENKKKEAEEERKQEEKKKKTQEEKQTSPNGTAGDSSRSQPPGAGANGSSQNKANNGHVGGSEAVGFAGFLHCLPRRKGRAVAPNGEV